MELKITIENTRTGSSRRNSTQGSTEACNCLKRLECPVDVFEVEGHIGAVKERRHLGYILSGYMILFL